MRRFVHLCLIVLPCLASAQEVVFRPAWEPGASYQYKLTYTIDWPDYKLADFSSSKVFLYNTLQVLGETDESWILSLRSDSIQLVEFPEYAAKLRLGKSLRSYHLTVAKDSAHVVIDQFEEIVTDLVDQLTGKYRGDRNRALKQEIMSSGGLHYLLRTDFDFLFVNYLSPVTPDVLITKDTAYQEWKKSTVASFQVSAPDQVTWSQVENYDKSVRRDTMNNTINEWHPVHITISHTIRYGPQAMPEWSEKVTVKEEQDLEYIYTGTAFERKLVKKTVTERVRVEILK